MKLLRILGITAIILLVSYLIFNYLVLMAMFVMLPEYSNQPILVDFSSSVSEVFSWPMQQFSLLVACLFGISYLIFALTKYLFQAIGYDFHSFVFDLSIKRIGHV